MRQQPTPYGCPDGAGRRGLTARVELTVTDADTAQARRLRRRPGARHAAGARAGRGGDGRPRRPPGCAPGTTTVGTRVELEHRAPTPVGRTVVAEATLAKVDGRRLHVRGDRRATATQTVAEGRVERVLVDRQRFLERAFGGA